MTIGLLFILHIPLPSPVAELSLNVQFVIDGLPNTLNMPPPLPSTMLPMNAQLVTVGLLPTLTIPPPPSGTHWSQMLCAMLAHPLCHGKPQQNGSMAQTAASHAGSSQPGVA
jgi:hypothetical protein